MTSKNLFFKLMKEDVKSRIWAVALIGLGCFFLYPVYAAFTAGDIREYAIVQDGIANYAKNLQRWIAFDNGLTVFVMIVLSLICGLSGFSYLNNKSKVDFYHGIPVKREKLYLANYIDGILILLVPYAVSLVLAVLVGTANGADASKLWPIAMTGFALHMTYFILMYTTVVVAAMMTGNLVVGVLGSLVLTFYVPLAVTLAEGLFASFFSTFDWTSANLFTSSATRVSPVMEYIYQVGCYNNGKSVWVAAAVALAAAVLLAAAGAFLYRKRPSEAAGRAMAFPVSCPVIRILLTLMAGIGLGIFFWSMRETTGWAVFGILCGTLITHCVVEIIYHFDFKSLFAHKGQLAVCTLVCVGVMMIFRYDLLGYDTYLPKAGQVKDLAVSVDVLDSWVSYGETKKERDGTYRYDYQANKGRYGVYGRQMRLTDTETVLNIAAAGIDYTMQGKEEEGLRGEQANAYPESQNTVVTIGYCLNSGRRAYRRYTVPVEAVLPQLEKLYADEQYQKGTYPLMNVTADQVDAVRYRENRKETCLNGLNAGEKEELLAAYQKEFKTMTVARMQKEAPIGLIRFTDALDEEALLYSDRLYRMNFDGDYNYSTNFSDRDFYPVYPSFTETLKLLEKHGIDTGRAVRDLDIAAVTVRKYSEDADGVQTEDVVAVITDPEEIKTLKPLLLNRRITYYDPLLRTEDVDISVTGPEDEAYSYRDYYLGEGTMPEFLEKRLKK